jgi:hypothetical protein
MDEIVADRYGDYLRSLFPDQSLDLAVVVGGAALGLYFDISQACSPPLPCWQLRKSDDFLLQRVPAIK